MDVKNFFKLTGHPKVGLTLSGGGARGFTHLGALKAFEEFGLKFDFVSGTSAGSLVGALYCAGMKFDDMLNIARKFDERSIRTSRLVFVPSKTDGIEKLVTDAVGDINIEDLKIPFTATAVDLKTTEEVCITKGNLAKAVAASCAVPAVFQPVVIDDFILCDGGLRNTMPADVPKLFGCDYVVAIDVNKSRLYGTESTKLLDVISCSIRILMEGNVGKGYKYGDVILAPETKRFRATKSEGYMDMIEEGYREAINQMPQIIKLFNKTPLPKYRKKRIAEKIKKPIIK